MPNKIADDRRRVVYIEEKDKWELLQKTARMHGTEPSTLVRIATHYLCTQIKNDPNFRIVLPLYAKY